MLGFQSFIFPPSEKRCSFNLILLFSCCDINDNRNYLILLWKFTYQLYLTLRSCRGSVKLCRFVCSLLMGTIRFYHKCFTDDQIKPPQWKFLASFRIAFEEKKKTRQKLSIFSFIFLCFSDEEVSQEYKQRLINFCPFNSFLAVGLFFSYATIACSVRFELNENSSLDLRWFSLSSF